MIKDWVVIYNDGTILFYNGTLPPDDEWTDGEATRTYEATICEERYT